VVDEERMSLVVVSALCSFSALTLLVGHGKDILPVKKYITYLQRFSSETSGGRQLTQVYLKRAIKVEVDGMCL